MCSYTAKVFFSCALILKMNVRSRTPEFAYINAPPTPYNGMQLQSRVQNRIHGERESNLRLIKIMSKWKANAGGAPASKSRPNSLVQRWRYCCRMWMFPFYSTIAVSTRLSLVLIYLFTYICSFRVVLLFVLGHHN